MIKKTEVFEIVKVRQEEVRENGDRIIFEHNDKGWVYHAPSHQDHTEEQLEIILNKLKELKK